MMFMSTGGREHVQDDYEDIHDDSSYKYNDTWENNAQLGYSSDKSVGDQEISEHAESHDQVGSVDFCGTGDVIRVKRIYNFE